jgi:hypothetical protein
MNLCQLEGELVAIAQALRRDDADRSRIADRISNLVDRLQGVDPLPRKKSDAIVFMATRAGSKRVQVQSVRGQFGL